jgi:DNA-binding transcriptional regulator GbsR (MarR family)
LTGLKTESLNQNEEEFIKCFSEFYEMRGRSETLGLVFGILFLRALNPLDGLTQKDITSLIGKSKSTVSRILDLLVDQKFCAYNLEENELTRAERRYYIQGSFKDLTISRTQKSIIENNLLNKNLQKIKDNIPEEEVSQNEIVITQIDQFTDLIMILNLAEKNTLKILQKHYENTI